MQGECMAKSKLANIAEIYKGDGVASYIKKPAFLASNGVRVDFEKFSLSSGFDRTFQLVGLPEVKKNSYGVYFSVNKKIEEDLAKKIFMDVILKDEAGNVIWRITNRLKFWRTGMERRTFFYLSDNPEDESGWLVPVEGESYTLRIHCWMNDGERGEVDYEGKFFLRAGGYK